MFGKKALTIVRNIGKITLKLRNSQAFIPDFDALYFLNTTNLHFNETVEVYKMLLVQ